MIDHTIQSSGEKRHFSVMLPRAYGSADRQWPVIVALHGTNGTGRIMARRWRSQADDDAICVFPTATYIESVGGTRWHSYGDGSGVDERKDEVFLLELLGQVNARYNGDPKNVFICGFSAGGAMTFHMQRFASDPFIGFGAVAKSLPKRMVAPGVPAGAKKPTILICGDLDEKLQWVGHEGVLSWPETRAWYEAHLGTTDFDESEVVGPNEDRARTDTIKRVYDPGHVLETYAVIGGGHRWFSYGAGDDINATLLMSAFARRHRARAA